MRVAIIGGGVMGSSLAFWLTAAGGVEITVIERDPSYARASSALSASGVRQQFSQAVNVEIGLFGAAFLREPQRWLGEAAGDAGIGLTEAGYLYLATAAGRSVLEANHAVQREHGADVELLEPRQLADRFPWLGTDDIALGSLGLSGEGWFDGYAVTRAFRDVARSRGARYLKGEVTACRRRGGRITALDLADGTAIEADVVVLSAGPWSGALGRRLGIELPVYAKRRTVMVLQCPEPPRPCPLVIDPSGVWFRPEGSGFIAGCPPITDDEDDLPLDPETTLFEDVVWPTMAARAPAFERLRLAGAWAGYYEMNTFDHNGLVGPWPGMDDLHVLTGFSGHGMQQAPACGRGLAELITRGRYTTLDLAPLSPDRLRRGEPLLERNVI